MRTKFTGVGTALITPFTTSGAVDEAAVNASKNPSACAEGFRYHSVCPCGPSAAPTAPQRL